MKNIVIGSIVHYSLHYHRCFRIFFLALSLRNFCASIAIQNNILSTYINSQPMTRFVGEQFEVADTMYVNNDAPIIPDSIKRGEPNGYPMRLATYLHIVHLETFASISAARKAVRRKEIMLNDIEATTKCEVNFGDCIKRLVRCKTGTNVHRNSEISIPVVWEDDYIAVVIKPPGMPVHGKVLNEGETREISSRGEVPSLRTAIAHCLKPSGATDAVLRRPQHVHRLDKPTGGLVICAKTRPALQNLSIAFEERKIQKRYRAMVTGTLTGNGVIDTPLSGKPSLTIYNVVQSLTVQSLYSGTISTVDLWPKTGRHHQLRKHLAGLGTPILGDKRYHPSDQYSTLLRGEGLFLWALELQLDHPITGEHLEFKIEEPEKFKKWREKEQRRFEKLSSIPKSIDSFDRTKLLEDDDLLRMDSSSSEQEEI